MTKQTLRRLLGTPAFTTTAILLLALAIAVSAAMGGLLEAVVLKPLPCRDPESLVWVWASRVDRDKAFFSIPDFLDHEAATRAADLVACSQWDTTLSGEGEPERIPGVRMEANGLSLLGVVPAAGRLFEAQEESRKVAVVSHDLWRRGVGAHPAALGQTLGLHGGADPILGGPAAPVAVSANLAGLMLARGAARRGEFAVRAALGARAPQLAREVLVETALLAVAGGVLGLVLAHWLLALLVRLGPRDLPRLSHASLDVWVALGTFAAIGLAAGGAALTPAL